MSELLPILLPPNTRGWGAVGPSGCVDSELLRSVEILGKASPEATIAMLLQRLADRDPGVRAFACMTLQVWTAFLRI